MASHSPEYSDDEFDFDEEYFSRTYQPLSNLPTPPPSSRESLADQSPHALLEDGGLLDSALLGPAIHLVNLVPPAASLAVPSVPLVHEMLVRSNLSMDAIALAVCILDSLNSKFSLNWRLLCPLAQHEPVNEITKRHTIQARPAGTTQLHIDSVNPEVIILAALIIASKFLADCQEPTNYYRSAWGQNMWTCDQINVTERCIMESLGYRILPLWDPVLIADAVNDMQRAAKQAARRPQPRSGEAHKRSASSAVVLSGPCLPLTPAETPVLEDGPTLTPVREAAGAGFGGEGLVPVDASMLDSQQCAKRKTIPAAD
ncbi:b7c05c74-08ff-427c-8b50-fef07a3e98a2 [Thermothielavioides terrestris]|uniref:Cyclin N-terminal domain-containing protein n=2 Tax=Thermothielavioides terrestris TaxID=2587410 RepID=G2R4F9_THETT|nr:uncharacterized protein THITE_2115452 [Thermothielavioides terrestris NRRL 8126]AEO66903.1 hypothetical protein THITE_2115452 [Thermothielavioides terrestris NRRL 8126]SPQ23603.1 b7c05c74-08ff-427c-8b50-fef07a3e98a2 [Thermothielavioides terrestris]